METPQHEIGPKKNENLTKMNIFQAFPIFYKIIGHPSNLMEFLVLFFDPFPRFLGRIPVYTGLLFLRDFFNIFEGFPNIFNLFPHFLSPFPFPLS